MRIALGSDHRGYRLKGFVMDFLRESGYELKDFGAYDEKPLDYPDIAFELAAAVSRGEHDFGILFCGTGIGMCIAANKARGIRAAVCSSVLDARRARQHNNANVLCLREDGEHKLVMEIVNTFLLTPFEGGRHERRIQKILDFEAL
ncbi:MAG TPA: ribose 5-phosphate isomerase B [Dehalococcoidia bacterium]|nr:ribose 5-phosphate isomerase B [Dehalococcoidia bacterium]